MAPRKYELLKWHDRRYRHERYVFTTESEAKSMAKRLNKGYSGPRFVIREA